MDEKIEKLRKEYPFFYSAFCVPFRILSFILLTLAAAILAFAVYGKIKSDELCSISSAGLTSEFTGEYSFSMTPLKSWNTEGALSCVAQYECEFRNESSFPVKDWSALLIVPPQSFISGGTWNGVFNQFNEKLFVYPVRHNFRIEPDCQEVFGFTLTSEEVLENAGYTVFFHRDVNPLYLPGFKVLLFAAIFIFGVLLAMKIYSYRIAGLRVVQSQCFDTIANIIDSFDENTCRHSKNVAFYAAQIAERMNFSQKDRLYIYYCGLVHDIGKISIMRTMLKKASGFTEQEMEIMKKHTVAGGETLRQFTSIPHLREAALFHHERYDGKGYPQGLKGREIPLFARIICVADSFDVMASKRPYKDEFPCAQIIKEFEDCSGTQFDPEIAPIMIQMIKEGIAPLPFDELQKENSHNCHTDSILLTQNTIGL